MRRIYFADGRVQDLDRKHSLDELKKLCGFKWADLVHRVVDGKHLMVVDDEGHLKGGQLINKEATKLYHSVCVPGTTHVIVGNVAVVPDGDIR